MRRRSGVGAVSFAAAGSIVFNRSQKTSILKDEEVSSAETEFREKDMHSRLMCAAAAALLSASVSAWAVTVQQIKDWEALIQKKEAAVTELTESYKKGRCPVQPTKEKRQACEAGFDLVIMRRQMEVAHLRAMISADSLPMNKKANYLDVVSPRAHDQENYFTDEIFFMLEKEFPEKVSAPH
ncbi:MAG: hypothetical protein AB7U61_07115 [Methylocystis sp.]